MIRWCLVSIAAIALLTCNCSEEERDQPADGGEELVCGDGIVNGTEVCDDGVNDGSYGGCGLDCLYRGPFCGDGAVNGGEACDDGVNDGSYGGCLADCSAQGPFCGDGTVNGDEACDGDALSGQSCAALGFSDGSLTCTARCAFDLSDCRASMKIANGAGLRPEFISPDDKLLLYSNDNHDLLYWDVHRGQGGMVADGCFQSEMHWFVDGGRKILVFAHQSAPFSLGDLLLFDVATGTVTTVGDGVHPAAASLVQLSPDKHSIVFVDDYEEAVTPPYMIPTSGYGELAIYSVDTATVTHVGSRVLPYDITFSPDGEELLYLADFDPLTARGNLYLRDSSGPPTLIAEDVDYDPMMFEVLEYSADFGRVVFLTGTDLSVAEDNSLTSLFGDLIMWERSTGSLTPIASQVGRLSLRFSPDGESLLYQRNPSPYDGTGELWLRDFSRDESTLLGRKVLGLAYFSPDSSQVAYVGEFTIVPNFGGDLRLVSLTTREETLIASEVKYLWKYKADDTQLAYQTGDRTNHGYFYILEAGTGESVMVDTNVIRQDRSPHLSQDWQRVIYQRFVDRSTRDLYVWDRTSGPVQVSIDSGAMAVSPSNMQMAFWAGVHDATQEIYLASIQSAQRPALVDSGRSLGWLVLSDHCLAYSKDDGLYLVEIP